MKLLTYLLTYLQIYLCTYLLTYMLTYYIQFLFFWTIVLDSKVLVFIFTFLDVFMNITFQLSQVVK